MGNNLATKHDIELVRKDIEIVKKEINSLKWMLGIILLFLIIPYITKLLGH